MGRKRGRRHGRNDGANGASETTAAVQFLSALGAGTGAAAPSVLAAFIACLDAVIRGDELNNARILARSNEIRTRHAARQIGTLEDALLDEAGLLEDYADERERLVAQAEDMDRVKESASVREAVRRLFATAGRATGEPEELEQALKVRIESVTIDQSTNIERYEHTEVSAAGGIAAESIENAHVHHHYAQTDTSGSEPRPWRLELWPRPYPPLDKHFTGRQDELDQLCEAFLADAPRVAIIGRGGQGKSTLFQKWFHEQRDLLADQPVLVYRCYEGHFPGFMEKLLKYLSRDADARFPERCTDGRQQAAYLQNRFLHEVPLFLVLDGVERWLKRWRSDPEADAADATRDDRAEAPDAAGLEALLAGAENWAPGGKLLMTTRALPSILDRAEVRSIGTPDRDRHHRHLSGLGESGVDLLLDMGVKDPDESNAGIRTVVGHYDGHPLTLEVLASLLVRHHDGDVAKVRELNLMQQDDDRGRLRRLLDSVTAHVEDELGVIRLIAVSRIAAPVEMLLEVNNAMAEAGGLRSSNAVVVWSVRGGEAGGRFDGPADLRKRAGVVGHAPSGRRDDGSAHSASAPASPGGSSSTRSRRSRPLRTGSRTARGMSLPVQRFQDSRSASTPSSRVRRKRCLGPGPVEG